MLLAELFTNYFLKDSKQLKGIKDKINNYIDFKYLFWSFKVWLISSSGRMKKSSDHQDLKAYFFISIQKRGPQVRIPLVLKQLILFDLK